MTATQAGTEHVEQEPNRRRPNLRRLRAVAYAIWGAAFVTELLTEGVPADRTGVFVWVISALVVANIGRGSAWRPVLDFLPLLAVLVAWDYLRGASRTFGMPTLWTTQIDFDRTLFGGVLPTVWLQDHLRHHSPRWWDAPVSLTYISFFIVPTATAAVLWLRRRPDFHRWVLRYVMISFVGFACFALVPAAPPWAAARCDAAEVASAPSNPACLRQSPALVDGGLLGRLPSPREDTSPYVSRTSTRGLDVLHLKLARKVVNEGADASDLVAGVPSLHAGVSLMIVIFFWPRVRKRWRPLLSLYPVAMAFTLLYTGDHYLFDIFAGWLAAVLVSVGAARLERSAWARRLIHRSAQSSAPEVAS